MGLESNIKLSFKKAHEVYGGYAYRAAPVLGVSVEDLIFFWRSYDLPIKKVGRPKGVIRPTFSDEEIDKITWAYLACDGNLTHVSKETGYSRQTITYYCKILDLPKTLNLPIRPRGRPKKSQ